jgi:hypothetical protein
MNFSLAALALAIIPAASAKNIKLSRNLRKSSPVARALLSNGARPYNPSGRKLQENALDGSYSLKVSSLPWVIPLDIVPTFHLTPLFV